MPVITPPPPPTFGALTSGLPFLGATFVRAVGLDDDAARALTWFSSAQREVEEARAQLEYLEMAREALAEMTADLTALTDTVRATLTVDWRSRAASERMACAQAMLAEGERLIATVGEWQALRAAAERDVERLCAEAEQRRRMHEAAVQAGLNAVAGG